MGGRKLVRGGPGQRISDGAVSQGSSLPNPSSVAHRHLCLLSLPQTSPCLVSSCGWIRTGRVEPTPAAVVDPRDRIGPFSSSPSARGVAPWLMTERRVYSSDLMPG